MNLDTAFDDCQQVEDFFGTTTRVRTAMEDRLRSDPNLQDQVPTRVVDKLDLFRVLARVVDGTKSDALHDLSPAGAPVNGNGKTAMHEVAGKDGYVMIACGRMNTTAPGPGISN